MLAAKNNRIISTFDNHLAVIYTYRYWYPQFECSKPRRKSNEYICSSAIQLINLQWSSTKQTVVPCEKTVC
jgi:hypothetical protein